MWIFEVRVQLIADAVAIARRVACAVLAKRDKLAPEGFANISVMFLARAAHAVTSVGLLTRAGFNADALSVARTALELSIDYPYTGRDLEGRMRLFTQEIHLSNRKLGRAIDVLWEGTVDRGKMDALEQA
jgi:hypothetical protein